LPAGSPEIDIDGDAFLDCRGNSRKILQADFRRKRDLLRRCAAGIRAVDHRVVFDDRLLDRKAVATPC
jgi:hypothetical protein